MTANTTTTSPQHPKPQTTRDRDENERQALKEVYELLARVAARIAAHEAEKSGA